MSRRSILPFLLASGGHGVLAQLSGSVGPTTSAMDKAGVKVCDVTDYGANSTSDFGPAFQDAFSACNDGEGGLVYVPPGEYPLQTGIIIKDISSVAVQWDGTVYRNTSLTSDYFIAFRSGSDFEWFSGNSQGAIQGYGYEYLQDGNYGTRMIYFQEMYNWSFHGMALVDSPSYYVVIKEAENAEIYNNIVRGSSNLGADDAFDVAGDNIWIHDMEITNGDECVTLKQNSTNFLIESIYCNLSGGTAIGSLGDDTLIENIYYKNLYMNNADPCYLKTNNGGGTVRSITWDTVYVHGGNYVLALNEAWGDDLGGTGIQISNLTFKNWYGYNNDNSRPTLRIQCDPDVPCYDITLDNVNLWTADGDYVGWTCSNAYGSGGCLNETSETTSLATYTTNTEVSTVTSWSLPGTMTDDFATALTPTSTFSIPAVPTTYFPGVSQISTLLSYTGPVTPSATQVAARDLVKETAIPM